MYEISIFKNNGSLQKLCNINEDSSKIEDFSNTNINSVNFINMKIAIFIKDSYMNDNDVNVNFRNEDISTTCYHIKPYRRFKLFFFIQKSDLGIRHLCYIAKKIVHNGFACDIPDKDSIIDSMIVNYIDDISYLINTDNEEYLRQVESIKSNFGI
tara:strand:- start:158 stop:622 length:465 start_codon:yes stop_codon:yes gene_type:complete